MIFTPAPMSASAASWAVSAGTAMTPTMMFLVAADLGDVRDRADGHVAYAMADLFRIALEDRGDGDPVLGEDRGARDGAAQTPCTRERDVVLALSAEDLADLVEQRIRAIADSRFPNRPNADKSRLIWVALMLVYSAISWEEIRSFPSSEPG